MIIKLNEKIQTEDGGFISFCDDGFVRVSCANRNGEGFIGAEVHHQLVQDIIAAHLSNKNSLY
jgi:hypothetical protein